MIVRKALPEAGELVLARVKKVMPFGAYCELIEYNMDAYLPIKEISSGWIKNIHEVIREGQREVAKVVFVDKERRAIDISFKKATTKEKKDKINDYNLEIKAENLFNQALKASDTLEKKEEIKATLAKKYQSYNEIVADTAENSDTLSSLKLNTKFSSAFYDIIKKSIKPKRYAVSYVLELVSYNTREGISTIKKALELVENGGVKVTYLGAPKYKLSAEDSSYPKAEDKIKQARSVIESKVKNATINMRKEK